MKCELLEVAATTAPRGQRKELPPNDFRKPVHRVIEVHSAILTYEQLFVSFLSMSEDLEGTSRLHVRDQRWKVVLVCMAVLTVALLSLLVTSQIKRGGELSRRHLPQSIEEFRAALNQPDFGMYFLDFSGVLPKPGNELTLDNAKLLLYELMGRRHANSGSTESIGNLVADYSAVARKRVSFGRSWQRVTNAISYDDSLPRTRGETLAQIESILRTNSGFIFPLNRSNVLLLTEEDLKGLGHALPGNGK